MSYQVNACDAKRRTTTIEHAPSSKRSYSGLFNQTQARKSFQRHQELTKGFCKILEDDKRAAELERIAERGRGLSLATDSVGLSDVSSNCNLSRKASALEQAASQLRLLLSEPGISGTEPQENVLTK